MCPQQLDHKDHKKEDARIHCAILNKRATHHPQPPGVRPLRGVVPDEAMVATVRKTNHRENLGNRLFFQDPTGCLHHHPAARLGGFPAPEGAVLARAAVAGDGLPVSPPMSTPRTRSVRAGSMPSFDGWCSLERR